MEPNATEIIKETFKAMCWGIFGGSLAVIVIILTALVWKALFLLAESFITVITGGEYGTPFLLIAIAAAIIIGILGGVLVYVFRDVPSESMKKESGTENIEEEEEDEEENER